jgi:hypothetical protein
MASEQGEAQSPSTHRNENARATASDPSADQTKTSVEESSSGQENSHWPSDLSSAVASGNSWLQASNQPSFSIPLAATVASSAATTTSSIATVTSSTSQPPTQIGTSGIPYQATIASAPEPRISKNSLLSSSAQTQAGESAGNRTTSEQKETQSPTVHGNGTAPATASIPLSDQENTPAEERSTGQENSHWPSGLSSAVASGESWLQAYNQPGRSIPSATTVTSSAATTTSSIVTTTSLTSQLPVQIGTSGIPYQATIASAPESKISTNSLLSSSAQSQTVESVGSRKTSEQKEAQLLTVQRNETAPATAAIPLSDQEKTPAKESPTGQENGHRSSDGSSGTSATVASVQVSKVTQDVPQQLLASQLVPDIPATERTVTPVKQLNQVASPDAAVDAESTVPIAASGMTDFAAGNAAPATAEIPLQPAVMQTATVLPNRGSGSQVLTNATQKTGSDASFSKNLDLANTTNAGTSKTTATAGGSTDTSFHGAQNSGQSSQNSAADPSQATAAMPKPINSGASQADVQTVVSQGVSHETATTHRTPDSSGDGSLPSQQREYPASIQSESGEAVTASGINATKLMQTMSSTEMRVGMHSTEFGDISIRTSVSQQQMLTQISLDHNELSQAISAHVSTVQAKLGDEYGLHASIEVNNLGSSLSGESGHSSQREQGTFTRSLPTESSAVPAEEESGLSLGALAGAGNGYRLDIRA